MPAMFQPFESKAMSGLELGADALLFVMTHDHAISVPDQALMFAEKVAIVSVARRTDAEGRPIDPLAEVLAGVNRAIDVIAATLRSRASVDRELAEQQTAAPRSCGPAEDLPGGHKVKTVRPVPQVPPAGAVAQMKF